MSIYHSQQCFSDRERHYAPGKSSSILKLPGLTETAILPGGAGLFFDESNDTHTENKREQFLPQVTRDDLGKYFAWTGTWPQANTCHGHGASCQDIVKRTFVEVQTILSAVMPDLMPGGRSEDPVQNHPSILRYFGAGENAKMVASVFEMILGITETTKDYFDFFECTNNAYFAPIRQKAQLSYGDPPGIGRRDCERDDSYAYFQVAKPSLYDFKTFQYYFAFCPSFFDTYKPIDNVDLTNAANFGLSIDPGTDNEHDIPVFSSAQTLLHGGSRGVQRELLQSG